MAQNASPQDKPIEVGTLRHHIEVLHEMGNAQLAETFKGTLEEKTVKTSSTGRYLIGKILFLNIKYLEIPITVYTPTDANKDKLGVYFHGGGNIIKINSNNIIIIYIRLGYR